MRIREVTWKLGNRRKAEDFVVYPQWQDGTVTVQSDKTIGRFDPDTGEGRINDKGSNYKRNEHLGELLGGRPFTFPGEFVAECVGAIPCAGDEIGPGMTIVTSHPEPAA